MEVVDYKLIQDRLKMMDTSTVHVQDQILAAKVRRHPSVGKPLLRYETLFCLAYIIVAVTRRRLMEPLANADDRERQNQGASGVICNARAFTAFSFQPSASVGK